MHDHRVEVVFHEDYPTEAKRCKLVGEGVSKEVCHNQPRTWTPPERIAAPKRKNLHRGNPPCSLRQRNEDIVRQRCDDGQNKKRKMVQVLPADKVLNLTESLRTLSVAAHNGVKDVLLLESAKSVRKMKHVPTQRQSRGAQRVTVTIHATAQTLPQHQRN